MPPPTPAPGTRHGARLRRLPVTDQLRTCIKRTRSHESPVHHVGLQTHTRHRPLEVVQEHAVPRAVRAVPPRPTPAGGAPLGVPVLRAEDHRLGRVQSVVRLVGSVVGRVGDRVGGGLVAC